MKVVAEYEERLWGVQYVRSSRKDVGCCVRTMHQIGFFSRASLVTWNSPFNSWRTWAWFGVRSSVTPPVKIWCDPQNQIFLKDSGGDVKRGFMGPAVVGWRPSSTARFQNSNLAFLKILLITYGIVHCEPSHQIQNELSLGKQTVRAWGMFCRETMLAFLESCSEKSGPNQTVEIDDSKFGWRKYHRGHPVQGQWVFGGVERGSSRLFLVPVPDRTADTLAAIIPDQIEPGTMVISDCWGAYCDLDLLGYTQRTVIHSLYFMHPDTTDHTNTTKSMWHRVKVFLGPYNRRGLPLPSYTLHVCGEVQGTWNTTFHTIPSPQREYRLV